MKLPSKTGPPTYIDGPITRGPLTPSARDLAPRPTQQDTRDSMLHHIAHALLAAAAWIAVAGPLNPTANKLVFAVGYTLLLVPTHRRRKPGSRRAK